MRRVIVGTGVILAVLTCTAGALLLEAHWEMRGIAPLLPGIAALERRAAVYDAPVRVSYVNTATQRGSGPAPVGHPGFLLEWSDGRAFLIDVGMTPEQAVSFGRPLEWLLGAERESRQDSAGPSASREPSSQKTTPWRRWLRQPSGVRRNSSRYSPPISYVFPVAAPMPTWKART